VGIGLRPLMAKSTWPGCVGAGPGYAKAVTAMDTYVSASEKRILRDGRN
jgi:hypothetical protein